MCAQPAHAWPSLLPDTVASAFKVVDEERLSLVQAAALVSLICSAARWRDALVAHLLGHHDVALELLVGPVAEVWVMRPVRAADLAHAECVLTTLSRVAAAEPAAAEQVAAIRAVVAWVAGRPTQALALVERAGGTWLGRSVRTLLSTGVPGPVVVPDQ